MSEQSKTLSITLKAGTTFDSPWVVVYADSVEDALALVEQVGQFGLDVAVASAAKELQAKYALASGGVAVQQVSSTPVAAPQAAPVQQYAPPAPVAQATVGRSCVHGAMTYREAKPDSGKDWRGYFCPTPQGTPGQCKAQFLRKGEAA